MRPPGVPGSSGGSGGIGMSFGAFAGAGFVAFFVAVFVFGAGFAAFLAAGFAFVVFFGARFACFFGAAFFFGAGRFFAFAFPRVLAMAPSYCRSRARWGVASRLLPAVAAGA